jgi:hypothetical protein
MGSNVAAPRGSAKRRTTRKMPPLGGAELVQTYPIQLEVEIKLPPAAAYCIRIGQRAAHHLSIHDLMNIR